MAEEATFHFLEKMTGMHEIVPITVTDSASGESWTAQVLLREIQKHPYKHKITHLDFWELPEAKPHQHETPLGEGLYFSVETQLTNRLVQNQGYTV